MFGKGTKSTLYISLLAIGLLFIFHSLLLLWLSWSYVFVYSFESSGMAFRAEARALAHVCTGMLWIGSGGCGVSVCLVLGCILLKHGTIVKERKGCRKSYRPVVMFKPEDLVLWRLLKLLLSWYL